MKAEITAEARDNHLRAVYDFVISGEPIEDEGAKLDCIKNPDIFAVQIQKLGALAEQAARGELTDPTIEPGVDQRLELIQKLTELGFDKGFGVIDFMGRRPAETDGIANYSRTNTKKNQRNRATR